MASILQYVKIMRDTQWVIAKKLGVDMAWTDNQTRALALSNFAVQGVLINLLVTKGVITDQELLAAVNALRNNPFPLPPEPPQPVGWDTTPVTGI